MGPESVSRGGSLFQMFQLLLMLLMVQQRVNRGDGRPQEPKAPPTFPTLPPPLCDSDCVGQRDWEWNAAWVSVRADPGRGRWQGCAPTIDEPCGPFLPCRRSSKRVFSCGPFH